MNFRAGWWDSHPKFRNPAKRITRTGDFRHEKLSVFRKILLLWNKIPVSEKITDFRVQLDNFLVSVVMSYCRSEVIIFWFYQEWNAIQCENLEFNLRILHILMGFNKIILCIYAKWLCILKISIAERVHILAISRRNHKFCQY